MANVLDLRRRIRSVKNTRQITKAMKMVSAAKLRRAQERALAARPYAKMITSVLESLTGASTSYDGKPATCVTRCLPRAREARLADCHQRRQRIRRCLQRQHLQGCLQFITGNTDKEIDVEAVGRKGRDLARRRFPPAEYIEQTRRQTAASGRFATNGRALSRSRATIPACLLKLEATRVFEMAESIISRYVHEEIDAAYIVYNEFKSVISQRLVVERLLPILKIGIPQITSAVEPTEAERERAAEAAASAGIALEPADTTEADEEVEEVRHSERGLHLRAASRGALQRPAAAVHFGDAVSRDVGVGGRRACGAHDGNGFGDQQCIGHD